MNGHESLSVIRLRNLSKVYSDLMVVRFFSILDNWEKA